jgi:hypothetical protein
MSYAYQYAEGLKQFGMVHLILKLTDSDNILPEVNVPVVLDDSENNEVNLARIANELINSYIIPVSTPVEESIPAPVEETSSVEETSTNNLSNE